MFSFYDFDTQVCKVESRPRLGTPMPGADVIKGGAVVFGNEKPWAGVGLDFLEEQKQNNIISKN